jgi:hypothetical protein
LLPSNKDRDNFFILSLSFTTLFGVLGWAATPDVEFLEWASGLELKSYSVTTDSLGSEIF